MLCMGNGQLNQTMGEMTGALNCMHDQQAIWGGDMETIVRRLTPKECERLQGYPDDFTNIGEWEDEKGKKHKTTDSARYKALGNSIALPYWQALARRIAAQYERPVTLGSLFDGISGFPLVFSRCGGKTLWTAEIEPFPVAVCKYHFGDSLKYLGDVTKINGAEIESPDVVSFGAPCQDLSVAGLRKGMLHEAAGDAETTRSGLFYEAIRIIKEMRKNGRDNGSPNNFRGVRFCIYENVPGALSSNRGGGLPSSHHGTCPHRRAGSTRCAYAYNGKMAPLRNALR